MAFLIGSGFATGQEIMQYFSSYGFKGILGVIVVALIFFYAGSSFMSVGQAYNLENGNEVYKHYFGKKIGTIFDYYATTFIYMSFIVMVAGAGAAVNEQYGLAVPIGGILLGIVAGAIVIFGLSNIVDIISKLGPAIIFLTLILGTLSIIKNPDGLKNANTILSEVEILKASSNWFFAAISYAGFSMIWLAGFLASLGNTSKSKRESVLGMLFGVIGFASALIIIVLGILANIDSLKGSQVPNLILAQGIHPILATIFSLIVVLGIYTTAVSLLWQVVARFSEEKTSKFRRLTIILTIIGILIGISIDFDKLVNVIYVINGYIGILLLVAILFNSIKNKRII